MDRTIVITFYTKPGCHLCEDAESLLEVAGRNWPLAITPINIRTDVALYNLFWNRIPVLEFDDGSTLEPPITLERLTTALAAHAHDSRPG